MIIMSFKVLYGGELNRVFVVLLDAKKNRAKQYFSQSVKGDFMYRDH